MRTDRSPLEQLRFPPIVEVVCGVRFSALAGLDPVLLGTYWDKRRDEYPGRQLQPTLVDGEVDLGSGIAPRVWFVSSDGAFILQFQQDRFYFNWRSRGHTYPRFSDHGEGPGILSRALREFEQFSSFCVQALGVSPVVTKSELSKVDLFVEHIHWDGFDDLSRMVPWLGDFARFATSDQPSVVLQFAEVRQAGELAVVLGTAIERRDDGSNRRVVKLETRIVKSTDAHELRSAFVDSNHDANDVFARLIPHEERTKRFSGEQK